MTTPSAEDAPRRAQPGAWLGIETVGQAGSVAVARVAPPSGAGPGWSLVASQPLDPARRSAQTLAPAIRQVLTQAGVDAGQLAAVAVAAGPGSFTGLRVGVVTAKTLAYAAGAAVIGVDSLAALAQGVAAENEGAEVWACLDAHRGEVFAASFRIEHGEPRRLTSTRRAPLGELAAIVGPTALVAAPSGLDLARHGLPDDRRLDAAPEAESVLRVARRNWLAGQADSVLGLAPQYFRLSAAEEKLADGG